MSRDMITDDSQEAFSIEESTTTFTDTGNTIQNVTITIGDTTYCFSKHSARTYETVGVHDIGRTPITVYNDKVTKKIKRVPKSNPRKTFWTTIEKVE